MKSLPLAVLAAGAFALAACDNKEKVTTVTPNPDGSVTTTTTTTTFSDEGANKFLEEYKGYAKDIVEAIKTGDKEKLAPLIAKGGELAAKGKEWASKLKPDEMEKYKAKLAEISKPYEEEAKKMAAAAMDKMKGAKDAAMQKIEEMKEKLNTPPPAPAPAPAVDPAPAPSPAPTPAPAPAQ